MNNIRDALQSFTKLEHGELLGVIARVSADTRSIKYCAQHFHLNELILKHVLVRRDGDKCCHE